MIEQENQNLNTKFNASYEQYSDAIFRYCLFQTSNREKAIDITQDTFIKTWEYLSRSEKEIENMRALLYKIAKNLIIDYRRKKKSESLDNLTEQGFDFSDEKNDMYEKETIFEGKQAFESINKLDEKYREVIMLRFVEDMEIKDIAKALNKSENNVSVRIHRGLEKLKNILENN
ncbi:MAG: RNA polymerase sigma factor [Candidatus Paceibacterota bacterium]|jgi:RNA polymerase sigma-70 factor (ECF subfamily)